LTDGDISIFESGAILLHLGERSDVLIPAGPRDRIEALQWLCRGAQFSRAGERALVDIHVLR
jgi:glutathione S-transferase